MSHDPLCPHAVHPDDGCYCRLIARVRADVLANEPSCVCKFGRGYAAALRDAVEAVKALPWHRPWGDDDTWKYLRRDDAVAAIEALDGER